MPSTAIVQTVILNNPFGCVSYMSSGTNHPPVEKTRESYTAKFVYQDSDAKSVGRATESYNTIAGYNAGITSVLANTANNTAHAGTPYHDADNDNFSASLKCHDRQRRDVRRELLPPAGDRSRPTRTTRSGQPSRPGRTALRPLPEAGYHGQRTDPHGSVPGNRTARLCCHPGTSRGLGPGPRPYGRPQRNEVRTPAGENPLHFPSMYHFFIAFFPVNGKF